jgi:SAM-dependent methyltransferase
MEEAIPIIRCRELAACPLCGSALRRVIVDGYDFETQIGHFRIEECGGCGVRYTNPQPLEEDIPLLYAQRSSEDFAMGAGFVNVLRRWVNRRLIRQLPQDLFERSVEVLDFGCGSGFFTQVARQEFKGRVAGSDFHDAAPSPEFAKSGIDYIPNDRLDIEAEKFDVIFCRNVLEHAISPPALARRLRELLKPEGYILLEVPCNSSWWAKIFGRYCYFYYLPRHLFHFDPRSLIEQMHGYTLVKYWTAQSPMMGKSIGYWLGRNIGNMSLLGLALFPLQVLVDAPFGRAPVLRAIFRKSR